MNQTRKEKKCQKQETGERNKSKKKIAHVNFHKNCFYYMFGCVVLLSATPFYFNININVCMYHMNINI